MQLDAKTSFNGTLVCIVRLLWGFSRVCDGCIGDANGIFERFFIKLHAFASSDLAFQQRELISRNVVNEGYV